MPIRFEFPALHDDHEARVDWVDSEGRVLGRWGINGVGVDVLSYEQLAAGEAVRRGHRVLLLGYAESLSDPEAAAVRAFCEQGGTVIADTNPAVRDGHCKPRPVSALADVFGVNARVGERGKLGRRGTLSFDGRFGNASVDGWRTGPALQLNGAEQLGRLGEAPAVLVKENGKGRAVYLNLEMSGYREHRAGTAGRVVRDLFGRLLGAAGVEAAVLASGGPA